MKIVYIDDMVDDLVLARLVIEKRLGHQFCSYSSCLDAVADIKTADIIFLDYTMPLMNGEEFYDKYIKGENIPVVFCSKIADFLRSQFRGNDRNVYFLKKPYTIAQMEQLIKTICSHAQR